MKKINVSKINDDIDARLTAAEQSVNVWKQRHDEPMTEEQVADYDRNAEAMAMMAEEGKPVKTYTAEDEARAIEHGFESAAALDAFIEEQWDMHEAREARKNRQAANYAASIISDMVLYDELHEFSDEAQALALLSGDEGLIRLSKADDIDPCAFADAIRKVIDARAPTFRKIN